MNTDDLDNKVVGERLKKIFGALDTNAGKVASALGMSNSRIYNLTLGVAKPNFDMIRNFYELYPNINLDYLFTGRGYPLKSSKPTLFSDPSSVELPYFESESSFVFSESRNDYGKKIFVSALGIDLTGCVVYNISDNAMSPQLHRGQKVIMKPLEPTEWEWLRSGVYAVRYANYLVIRRVKENDLRENGKLILWADNEKEGAIHLKRSDIISIYSVIQVFGSVE
ncbi:helix-turn-helix transcriptional regulator [Runella slithyformis]|uniref:Phage repressor n=1 Tax=Runella slithyformis (strain ATCC 29530 / DSM 19594 / LMG 11500 / NCIMB 11436 / LSU 4) TaxID=761193 RepID=A0A7U3ZNB5_RUNSL|nr:helix-turn-helix transcriptional regulator [Runella slithyformis]AEI50243.1 phage repressor [Runella slithyformis DSM 19594]